jgi:hypothetical protein
MGVDLGGRDGCFVECDAIRVSLEGIFVGGE